MIVWGSTCGDCGAVTGARCDEACPSAVALDHAAIVTDAANYEPFITAAEVLPGGGVAA